MNTTDAQLAQDANAAGMWWVYWRKTDLVSIEGSGIAQLGRLLKAATVKLDVIPHGKGGNRWFATALR